MSNIQLPASLQNAKIDTYTRTSGADTVQVQTMVSVNPVSATTGTLTAAAQTVVATGMGDMDGVLVTTTGTFTGTIAFEASNDGTNWFAVLMNRASSVAQESTRALTGTTLEAWRANVSGFGQFRVRCSAYTSGTASITVQPCSASFEPPAATVTVTQGVAGVSTWPVVNRANIFYNESTTAQAAAATVTGTSRDVGIAAATSQPYPYFKAFAFADQAGTMRIEVSNDNATWRRATVDTAVAANTPVVLSVPVLTRYHRVVYVNGATLQTAFMLNSAYTAS